MTLTLGSSSAIFACNLSSLGARVVFLGMIGKDMFGEFILQALKEKGVDTSFIVQRDELSTGATLVLNYGEDRAMITHQGAMAQMKLIDIPMDIFSQASHLHFSSYFLQPALQKDVAVLFKKAKKAGLTTSFDMQWDPSEQWDLDFNTILQVVDVFLPNETELIKLTGADTLEAAVSAVKNESCALVVKMVSRGSTSFYNGKRLHQPPFLNERVVDAIGAGDSFNAGFIFKYCQNAPIEICQEFGNLIGAISTTAPGGTTAFTTPNQIMELAKHNFGYAEHEFKN
jgi:sugar/nucleoside kinase (ribokinase family)